MILLFGRINSANRDAVWNESNFVWIEPTKDMSLFDVNEFGNNIIELDHDELVIWTNNKELIDRLSRHVKEVWRIEEKKLDKFKTDEIQSKLTLSETITRNWL